MKPVSVMMIAYNAEKTLARALNSVITQTMRDIEVICVDDCSTDSTPEILESYARKDSRITVLRHKKNMGQFAARYTGIMHAHGEYALLMDSDDELVENACEDLYGEIVRQAVDVLQFGAILRTEQGSQVSAETMEKTKEVLSIPEASLFGRSFMPGDLLNLCYVEHRFPFTVWNKMYRLDILKKAFEQYDKERILMADDCLATFMVLCYTRTYGVIHHSYYVYYVGRGISTEAGRIGLSSKVMERMAEEYQVYQLAKKWVTRTEVPDKKALQSIMKIHEMVTDGILWCFLRQASVQQSRTFQQYLCRYYPKDEFVHDLATYVFKQHRDSPEKLASRLKGYPPFFDYSRIGEIKTVGMYYQRLYNGGAERVVALLTAILMSAGYRVVVITQEPENEKDYSLPDGAVRVCLNAKKGGEYDRIQQFRHIIKTHGIEAMIYHSAVSETLAADSFAIKSTSIPLILYVHMKSTAPFEWAGCRWHDQQSIYSLFDKVITLTDVDHAWWKALGFDAVKVPNPLTFPLESTVPAALDNCNCIWCGRLHRVEKQYYDAFEIARQVHEEIPDFRLHVVGTSESREELDEIARYIEQNGMGGYVLFYGYQEDVSRYYQKASVCLSTSKAEGFGLTFIESKVFGLPLVTYDLPNVDAIRHPQGTFVVPQRDIVAAAERIIELMRDSELRHRMGKEARKSVETLYQTRLDVIWKDILDHMLEPREKETALSQLPPLVTAVRCAMDSVSEGVEATAALQAQCWQPIDPALADIYLDGYFVKMYKAINKAFPKGGKGRERMKKLAGLFLR